MNSTPLAVIAADIPPRVRASVYPPAFAAMMAGREKRVVGDLLGLTSFGVNLTRLSPGAQSALLHAHSRQQEFFFVLEGTPTLVTNEGERLLRPGMCGGFAAGSGVAHHLVNRSNADAVYLEVGDRVAGDLVDYPNDDLMAVMVDGAWRFTHKDGSAY